MPGISVKIVDIDAGENCSAGESGIMMIKGPNVMAGYLKDPEKSAEVLEDGWYNSGDIAVMDNESSRTITGRLSRFSKIAGEEVKRAGAILDEATNSQKLFNAVLPKKCVSEVIYW